MRQWIAASMGVLFLSAVFVSSSVPVQAARQDRRRDGRGSQSRFHHHQRKDAPVKLVVDTKTKVVGTGVGTKEAEMKKEKKTPQIIDFVKTGDTVSASYDDATKQAKQVRITKAAAK